MDWKKWTDEIPQPNKQLLIRIKDDEGDYKYRVYVFIETNKNSYYVPPHLEITHWCYIKEPREKMLPCPFCGSLDLFEMQSICGNDWFWMECGKCEACGPLIKDSNDSHDIDSTIRIWNKRISDE